MGEQTSCTHTPGYHAIARPSVERLLKFVEAIEVSGRQEAYRSWRMVAVEDELAWRALGLTNTLAGKVRYFPRLMSDFAPKYASQPLACTVLDSTTSSLGRFSIQT